MNHHLYRYCGKKLQGAKLTRSRPWQKNDNRFVEQKNYSLVRAYLGHMYLRTSAQADMLKALALAVLNDLYIQMWLYYNFFQPVLRQSERKVIATKSGICRIRRKQDVARTPLERLLEKENLDPGTVQGLLGLYQWTNPRALRDTIYRKLHALAATTA